MSKKKELASEEWDFSVLEKAPRTLVHRAMQWELDRELGSGKEPFLKSAECRKALAAGGKSKKGSASGIVELGKAAARRCRLRSRTASWSTGPSRVRS
jgi:hypothetical protein